MKGVESKPLESEWSRRIRLGSVSLITEINSLTGCVGPGYHLTNKQILAEQGPFTPPPIVSPITNAGEESCVFSEDHENIHNGTQIPPAAHTAH